MKDIENAYRILELNVGASFKKVAEARDELLALWDTERLAHNPRLRSRSAGKIQEINQAYETLMEHLGSSEVGRGSRSPTAPAPTRRRVRSDSAARSVPPGTEQPSTSLFEEVFSGDKAQQSRRIPVWLIVVLVTTAALAIGYVAQSTRGERPPSDEAADPHPVPQPLEHFGSDDGSSIEMLTVNPADAEQLDTTPIGSGKNHSGEAQSTESLKSKSPTPPQRLTTKPTSSPPKPSTPPISAPKARAQKKSAGAKAAAHKSDRPVLVRQKTDSEPQPSEAQLEEEAAKETKRREEAETAYQLLMIKSVFAKGLVAGESRWHFVEWKIIKHQTPEIWIDIITKEIGEELLHFIWSVNLKTDAIRPLSEAARNLGRSQ